MLTILVIGMALELGGGAILGGAGATGLGVFFFKKWIDRTDKKLDLIPDIHTRVVRLEKDTEYQAAQLEDVRREQTAVRQKLEKFNEHTK